MVFKCPSCQNRLDFDVSTLKKVFLRFECPSCGKRLVLADDRTTLFDAEEKEKRARIEDLVSMAMADGSIDSSEERLLYARARESGVDEQSLNEMLAKHRSTQPKEESARRVEDYAEAKAGYQKERGDLVKVKVLSTSLGHMSEVLAQYGSEPDLLCFKLQFYSLFEKSIRAFQGNLVFMDLFDKPLMNVGMTYEGQIHPRRATTWDGQIEFSEFDPSCRRLASINVGDLKARVELSAAIFTDGQKWRASV